MTIFLAAKQRWALQWNHNGFDDVRLTGPSAETSTKGNIPTIKNAVDGAAVILLGKVVSASAAQIGAYYVQEPNRQNGIRVEAISGSADVGELVNVSGWMATVDGERVDVYKRQILYKLQPADAYEGEVADNDSQHQLAEHRRLSESDEYFSAQLGGYQHYDQCQ